MKKATRIKNDGMTKELFEDIMFFSLAEGGAMGNPGSVYFYNKVGTLYYFNYARSCINMNRVKELFPPLALCRFGMLGMGSSVPEGWNYVNLGMGNHLIVNDAVYEEFKGFIGEDYIPSRVYGLWMKLAEKILEKQCDG